MDYIYMHIYIETRLKWYTYMCDPVLWNERLKMGIWKSELKCESYQVWIFDTEKASYAWASMSLTNFN